MFERLYLAAQWIDDCQGKKDYDGIIIKISTRYWPVGGGFHVLMVDGIHPPEFKLSDNSEIKPSARCSLEIRHGDPEDESNRCVLAEMEIEGDSFEEIAPKIEQWAQEKMDRVVKAVKAEFEV